MSMLRFSACAPCLTVAFLGLAACGGGDDAGTPTEPALDLGNPIHVVPGSLESGADGSEEHPFATTYDALDAIARDTDWDGKVILHAGEHLLPEGTDLKEGQVAFPKNADVEIQAGATIKLGYKVGMQFQRKVEVRGAEGNEVLFTWLDTGDPWGAIANFEETSLDNVFEYAIFEHGFEVTFNSIAMRGALSLRLAGGRVSHCTFRNNAGDDGANLRKSPTVVEFNTFENNAGDALDTDQEVDTEVAYNYFSGNTNDAIDMGEGCTANIHHNVVFSSGDKGVSIGERSAPTITNNLFVNCSFGLGIKDSSTPTIANNTFYGNRLAIAAYEAIEGYGPGKGTVKNSIIWGSREGDIQLAPTLTDSTFTEFSHNCIQSGQYMNPTGGPDGTAITLPVEGAGNTSAEDGCEDPMFVNPTDATNPDFHLKSTAGHYDKDSDAYIEDDETSPCIDAGDPDDAFDNEPEPNGGRIDLGCYGNHEEASHSP
jgi:parallel beta-helix repeat protein